MDVTNKDISAENYADPEIDETEEYLDEEAKQRLRSLDPNFLNNGPLLEFQKSKSYNQQSNKNLNAKGKKKPKEMVISLKFDDESETHKFNIPRKKKNQIYYTQDIDIIDQSPYKFVLKKEVLQAENKFNYSKYVSVVNVAINWSDVEYVIYNSSMVTSCPICIEKNVVVPKITRCGHIMCWPCLERFHKYWLCNNSKGKKFACPLCQAAIEVDDTRFCEIWSANANPYNEDESITFNLLMKEKKSTTLYNTNMDHDLSKFKAQYGSMKFVPFCDQPEFSFSKLFVNRNSKKRFVLSKDSLLEALKDEESGFCEESKISVIKQCIAEIETLINLATDDEQVVAQDDELAGTVSVTKVSSVTDQISEADRKNSLTALIEDSTLENNSSSCNSDQLKFDQAGLGEDNQLQLLGDYFFQEHNGESYYLHPIDYNIMLLEYGSPDHFPTEITGKILEIETFQVNSKTRSLYKFLSHLRNGSLFFFVEIDMKDLVSNHTLKQFQQILKPRAKNRYHQKQEEDHYHSHVTKIVEKEENRIKQDFLKKKYNIAKMNQELEEEGDSLNRVPSGDNSQTITDEVKGKKNMLKMLFNDEIKKEEFKNEAKKGFCFDAEDFPEISSTALSLQTQTQKKEETKTEESKEENSEQRFTIVAKPVTQSTVVTKSKKGKKKKFEEMNANLFKKIEANLFELQNNENNAEEEILICDNNLNKVISAKNNTSSIKLKTTSTKKPNLKKK